MLILECSQGCDGRTEGRKDGRKEGRTNGNVTISLRNFIGEGIIKKLTISQKLDVNLRSQCNNEYELRINRQIFD
jgi:hypothetical protein